METSLPVLSGKLTRECLENMKPFFPPYHGSQEWDLAGGISNI